MKITPSKITAAAGLLLCLLGCHGHEGHGHDEDQGHADQGHADQGHDDQGHDEHEPGHDSHGDGLQLALNEGKKWPVDDSTRASATKLAALVTDAGSIKTVDDARALGTALDQELDTLVKGCKMTGPAHDQLHLFLVALFPQVEALKNETDGEDLQRAGAEIGTLLEAYSNHFE